MIASKEANRRATISHAPAFLSRITIRNRLLNLLRGSFQSVMRVLFTSLVLFCRLSEPCPNDTNYARWLLTISIVLDIMETQTWFGPAFGANEKWE